MQLKAPASECCLYVRVCMLQTCKHLQQQTRSIYQRAVCMLLTEACGGLIQPVLAQALQGAVRADQCIIGWCRCKACKLCVRILCAQNRDTTGLQCGSKARFMLHASTYVHEWCCVCVNMHSATTARGLQGARWVQTGPVT